MEIAVRLEVRTVKKAFILSFSRSSSYLISSTLRMYVERSSSAIVPPLVLSA